MADADDRYNWEVEDAASQHQYSYSAYCEWECCDDPEHEKQSGFIVLTPREGVSVGGVINRLEEQPGMVVKFLVRLPCYLTEEQIAEAEVARLTQ